MGLPLGSCIGFASTSTLDVFTAGYVLAGTEWSFPSVSAFAAVEPERAGVGSIGAELPGASALEEPACDVELRDSVSSSSNPCLARTLVPFSALQPSP